MFEPFVMKAIVAIVIIALGFALLVYHRKAKEAQKKYTN